MSLEMKEQAQTAVLLPEREEIPLAEGDTLTGCLDQSVGVNCFRRSEESSCLLFPCPRCPLRIEVAKLRNGSAYRRKACLERT